MKKISILVVTALLLCFGFAGSARAADLKAGWYSNLISVGVFQYVGGEYVGRASGWFLTPPGQYGPFQVTNGPYHSDGERDVTVPTDAFGVGPDASLELPMGFGMTIGEPIAYINFSWGTDYDATQMYAELWRHKYGGSTERVWSQQLSGQHGDYTKIWMWGEYEGNFFYRVNVVPEPQSILGVFTGVGMLALAWRRRR